VPFKSKAQRRKFAQLLVEGKISDETSRATGGSDDSGGDENRVAAPASIAVVQNFGEELKQRVRPRGK
jgi:hypothetical protein